jgi:diamine N-acetyltransferase
MKEAAMARVGLRDIVSSEDRAAVMGLRRGPGQDQYLNSMEEIFAEAGEEQRAMPHPWAVHDAQTGALVGFAMISDKIPPPIDDDLVGPYFLWKLLIGHRFQRRGYGVAALDAVVGCYLATRPGAGVLHTSCADGRGSPREFYLRYGFAYTGRVMWGENVLALGPRREADRGLPRPPPPDEDADHAHLCAPVDEHERSTSHPERRLHAPVARGVGYVLQSVHRPRMCRRAGVASHRGTGEVRSV